jgi:hypothetical protein
MAETQSTSSELNLYQKLAKIRKQVEVMKKDTKAYGYKYVKVEEILAKITVFMDKLGISLLPGIVPGTTEVEQYSYKKTKVMQNGTVYEENVNEILVCADTTWTWVNNDNPEERIEVPWSMVGQQTDASQSFGSGLTYSFRYFLQQYFNIATSEDDPDNFRSKQKEAEAAEAKEIVKAIVDEIDTIIRAYLGKHPEKKEEIGKLAAKHIKGGNYFNIKDVAAATKLLEDVQKYKED